MPRRLPLTRRAREAVSCNGTKHEDHLTSSMKLILILDELYLPMPQIVCGTVLARQRWVSALVSGIASGNHSCVESNEGVKWNA